MAIIGKVRSVRRGEGIECAYCGEDASYCVESHGQFIYYCKDHYEDLRAASSDLDD